MDITNLAYSVHPMDLASAKVDRRDIPNQPDLEAFVKQLITYKALAEENRKFHWPSPKALVPATLKSLISDPDKFIGSTQVIAERLHEKEIDAQKEVERLDVEVQK